MNKVKIALWELEKWEEDYLREKLQNSRLELKFFLEPLTPKLAGQIKEAQILVIFIYSPITREIIARLPRLQFIATMSTGFDHIDLPACRERKIKISNVPFYGENTVAEHTFALILALSRRLPESIDRVRAGNFKLEGLRGFDLQGQTLGIVGLGHIGSQVAKIAAGLGMRILASDPRPDRQIIKKLKIKLATLEYLLAHSDIVTLHAPYSQPTHHLINQGNIHLIKKGAYLINTARGGLVETAALLVALDQGILAGAGLDVLEEECFIKEEKELLAKPFQIKCDLTTVLRNHLLIQDPRVLITPHNAFNSTEALQRILETTSDNIQSFLRGQPINLI